MNNEIDKQPLKTANQLARITNPRQRWCSVVLDANTGTGLTYQWQNGSGNISDATNSTYTATSGDNYKVIVTQNSCSATSTATTVTLDEGCHARIINDNSASNSKLQTANYELNIYPNPNDCTFTIEITLISDEEVRIIAYDLLGQMILNEQRSFPKGLNKLNLDLGYAHKGIYFLNIKTTSQTFNRKVIIE